MTYGIVGAMSSEVEKLCGMLTRPSALEIAGMRFVSGSFGGENAVVVRCGVGKVNAALCTQLLIDRFGVDALVNIGVAGGVAPELRVLDAVVADALVEYDVDMTALGSVRGYLGEAFGADGSKPTLFSPDTGLSGRLFSAACACIGSDRCRRGLIASGDIFVAESAQKEALRENFGALAAEMEGAAVAHTASVNGVPFAVLRTVSDLADGSAPVSFERVEKEAADTAADILLCALAT